MNALSSPVGFDPGRLEELAARCEAAAVPDRELSAAIALAVHDWLHEVEGNKPLNCRVRNRFGSPVYIGGATPDMDYTASLDAAMTLVPEECGYRLHAPTPDAFGKALPGVFGVELWWVPAFPGKVGGKSLASMALALCAAALRARAVRTPPSKPTEK